MNPRQWRPDEQRPAGMPADVAKRRDSLERRSDALCKGPIIRVRLTATGTDYGYVATAHNVRDTMTAYGRGASFDEALTELEGKLKP